MTSTGINQGLTEDSKTSSKVLRPPGGGSSISFGGEPDPAPSRQSQRGHVQPVNVHTKPKAQFGESDHVEKILPQTRGSDSKNRIFGDDYVSQEVAPRITSASKTHSNIFGEGDDQNGTKRNSPEYSSYQVHHRGRLNKLRRGNYNPITGEVYEKTACHQPPPKPVPTKNYKPLPSAADGPGVMQSTSGKANDIKTSSRVLNPPGGPTTKLW